MATSCSLTSTTSTCNSRRNCFMLTFSGSPAPTEAELAVIINHICGDVVLGTCRTLTRVRLESGSLGLGKLLASADLDLNSDLPLVNLDFQIRDSEYLDLDSDSEKEDFNLNLDSPIWDISVCYRSEPNLTVSKCVQLNIVRYCVCSVRLRFPLKLAV